MGLKFRHTPVGQHLADTYEQALVRVDGLDEPGDFGIHFYPLEGLKFIRN